MPVVGWIAAAPVGYAQYKHTECHERKRRMVKQLLLIVISSTIALISFVMVYEVYKSNEYDQWKENYEKNVWIGKLTRPSSNAKLIWEYHPNREYIDEQGVSIRTNAHGFRESDAVARKPDTGSERFAFIGDSVTLGMRVENEDSFVRQFQALADEQVSSARIEALNFGVDGYNTLQVEEALVTRVLDFAPRHVVYVMCLNDFDFDGASGKKILYLNKPDSFFVKLVEGFFMHVFSAGRDYHEYHFERNQQAVFNSILGMQRVLQGKGISFHVVLVPAFKSSTIRFPAGMQNAWLQDYDKYPLVDMHAEIVDFLQSNGIHTIDLLNEFESAEGGSHEYALDIWHPDKAGHALIAESLVQVFLPGDASANDEARVEDHPE